MKAQILNQEGKKAKEITLPVIFETKIRKDIIKKVFETIKDFQAYGNYILAGKDVSASGKQRHARHRWKTTYGYGISRVPRKSLGRRGDRFVWVAAFMPGSRKGRQAHPPKSVKNKGRINRKEKTLALFSAISATASKEAIKEKYNLDLENLPIIINSDVLNIKPKQFEKLMVELFKTEDIAPKKIRAGKGTRRNRKYKTRRKVLLVVSKDELKQSKKLQNIGLDIEDVKKLSVLNLAPGGVPGRFAVYTEKAIEELSKIVKWY